MIKIQKLKIYSIKTIIFVSMISIFYTKATHSACDVPLLNKTEEWLFENAPKLSGVISQSDLGAGEKVVKTAI
jgi:hypothetical protein